MSSIEYAELAGLNIALGNLQAVGITDRDEEWVTVTYSNINPMVCGTNLRWHQQLGWGTNALGTSPIVVVSPSPNGTISPQTQRMGLGREYFSPANPCSNWGNQMGWGSISNP